MRIDYRIGRLVCVLAVLAASTMALGQDGGGKTKFTSLLNVDSLVDNYARFLARKYNLNEDQEAFTTRLMHEKANTFLAPRRDELFGLVDRMFEVRTGGGMQQNELVDWGKSIAPMYDEAKRLIVEGNNQFRTILNDEQKAIHDQDLKQMEESFAQTDDQLRRIQSGEMSVEEFRNPPRQPSKATNTPTPVTANPSPSPAPAPTPAPAPKGDTKPTVVTNPNPGGGGKVEPKPAPITPNPPPPPPVVHGGGGGGKGGAPPPPQQPTAPQGRQFEGEWDQYTRSFIERYSLDSEQTAKAETILKDCKEQGARYVKSKDGQIKALEEREAKLREGAQDAAKQKEQQQIQKDKQKLFEPLGQIFEKQLKPRLDKLPTMKQRKDGDAKPAGQAPSPGKSPRPGSGIQGGKAPAAGGKGGATPPPPAVTPTPVPPPAPAPVPTPAPGASNPGAGTPHAPPPAPTPPTEDGKPSKPDE